MLTCKEKTMFWNSETITTKEGQIMLKSSIILNDKMIDFYTNNPELMNKINNLPMQSFVEVTIEFFYTRENFWKVRLIDIVKTK